MGCAAELVRLKAITAAVEAECGVDAVPTADDAIQVEESFWGAIRTGYFEENLRDDIAQAGLGRAGLAQPSGRWAEVDLVIAAKGVGGAISAGNLPEWHPLMLACGTEITLDLTLGDETVTYSPKSSDFDSVSIYAFSAGMRYRILGAMGTCTITFTGGAIGRMAFSFRGILAEVSNVALITPDYAQRAVLPPPTKSALVSIDSFLLNDFETFEFMTNTVIAERPRGNSAFGNGGYVVTDWDPQFRVNLDRPVLTSLDPWAQREAGDLVPWNLGPLGTVQYNTLRLAGPAARVIEIGQGDQDGIAMVDVTYRAQNEDENSADTAWALTVGEDLP